MAHLFRPGMIQAPRLSQDLLLHRLYQMLDLRGMCPPQP